MSGISRRYLCLERSELRKGEYQARKSERSGKPHLEGPFRLYCKDYFLINFLLKISTWSILNLGKEWHLFFREELGQQMGYQELGDSCFLPGHPLSKELPADRKVELCFQHRLI